MIPNKDQIWSFIRWGLTFGGGILVAKGYLSAGDLNTVIDNTAKVVQAGAEIIGPIAAIATIVSSAFVHAKAATVARAADIVPIDSAAQRSVGIAQPQLVPTNPKVT